MTSLELTFDTFRAPTRPAVVMMHGVNRRRESYRPLAEELAAAGHRIVLQESIELLAAHDRQ